MISWSRVQDLSVLAIKSTLGENHSKSDNIDVIQYFALDVNLTLS